MLQSEGDAEAQEKWGSRRENPQKKQKFYYNQKHAVGDLLTVGSLVLKKDFRRKRRRGGKMDYRWQDPIVTKS